MADGASVGAPPPPQQEGVYCSTAGTFFHDKESLAEHYRSDFHRYNLKRKVAGLPPVTKEWFEARRAQLLLQQQQQQQQGANAANAPSSAAAANADTQLMLGASAAAPGTTTGDDRVWYDPLTRRRFYSENTYVAHTRSRKYSELVKKSGAPPPPPVVSRRPAAEAAAAPAAAGPPAGAAGGEQGVASGVNAEGKRRHRAPRGEAAAAGGFVVKPAAGTSAARLAAAEAAAAAAAAEAAGGGQPHEAEEDQEDDGSEWETASMDEEDEDEDGDDEAARWAEADTWDARRSLFDTRVAPTLEDNLEYMWKTYGFSIPDAEACADPEGLLRYLGAKLAVGRVPLYARGDDASARRFRSLHAVQRHMVDSGRCRMLYDDNEEEYEEFYDYSRVEQEGEEGGEEAAMEAEGGGGESGALVVSGGGGRRGTKAAPGEGVVVASSSSAKPLVLGTRALARYYKQRTRPDPAARESVAAALVVARYRALGVETLAKAARREAARAARGGTGVVSASRDLRKRLAVSMRANVNHDLPKNVPY
jgi:pre-60S factor REI1